MRTFNLFLKRAFDIFVSTLAILLLTVIPVLIIINAMIMEMLFEEFYPHRYVLVDTSW